MKQEAAAYLFGLQLDGQELGLDEFDLDLLLVSVLLLLGLEERGAASIGGSDV